jgi:hypothetical protein
MTAVSNVCNADLSGGGDICSESEEVTMLGNSMSVECGAASVKLSTESGIVVAPRQISETRVHGSVSQGRGSISSSVHRRTEFAVIGTDGVERPHWFNSHDMFLRAGHRVSLLYGTYRGTRLAFIVNHDTRETLSLYSNHELVYALGILRRISFFGILGGILATAIMSSIVLAIVAVVMRESTGNEDLWNQWATVGTGIAGDVWARACGVVMQIVPAATCDPGVIVVGGPFTMLALVSVVQWVRAQATWDNRLKPAFVNLANSLLASTDQVRWPAGVQNE